jgi:hypothetical protein
MIEEQPSKRPAVRDVKTLSVYHGHDAKGQCGWGATINGRRSTISNLSHRT